MSVAPPDCDKSSEPYRPPIRSLAGCFSFHDCEYVVPEADVLCGWGADMCDRGRLLPSEHADGRHATVPPLARIHAVDRHLPTDEEDSQVYMHTMTLDSAPKQSSGR